MLHTFQNGVIVDRVAGQDIKNNDIYILDPHSNEVRKAKDCDEWLTCQVVYVNEYRDSHFTEDSVGKRYEDGIIPKGTECRCWIGFFRV